MTEIQDNRSFSENLCNLREIKELVAGNRELAREIFNSEKVDDLLHRSNSRVAHVERQHFVPEERFVMTEKQDNRSFCENLCNLRENGLTG